MADRAREQPAAAAEDLEAERAGGRQNREG